MTSRKFAALLVLSLLVFATPIWAQQTTGTISGVVKDSSGAVVPNATVTITDTARKIVVRTMTTGSSGTYSAPQLPIGSYEVKVEASGFKKFIQSGIGLSLNDTLNISPTLQIGSADQTVSVEATAEQVNTQSAVATGLVTGTQIRELSLSNRNFLELVFTVPGTSNSGNASFFPGATAPLGTNVVTIQVNGNRREQNNFMVDGADNVDRGSNLTLLSFPSVDAIAEFRVVRGVYDADSGRSAGAQINAITRSGTSSLHGSAYEFFRNNVLNANSYFNNRTNPVTPRPVLRYNDFGGTLGGPVWIPKIYEQTNKTFFFFSEEVRRIITVSNPTGTIPYAGMVNNGGTAQFNHTVCTQYANLPNGTAGPCTQYGSSIPWANVSPIAQAYVKDIFSKFPTPNAPTAANPFNNIASLKNVFNFNETLIKIDHVFNSKLSINGKYLSDRNPTVEQGGLFTNMPISGIGTTSTNSPGHQYNVAATWTPSPTFLVDGGWRYSYGAILSTPTGALSFANSPGLQTALGNSLPFQNVLGRAPNLTMTGGSSVASYGPYDDYNVNQSWYGNVTKVHGAHTLKFGAVYYHYNKHENQLTGSNNGAYSVDNVNAPTAATTFGGSAVCTGTAAAGGTCPFSFEQTYANFLLGNLSSFSQASLDVTANIFQNSFEYYGQDTWRVRQNVTLTFGIRQSFFRQPTDASGADGSSRLVNFDPASYDPSKAPCINSAGLMDVTFVNGVPSSSACNPNYNPLNGLIFANPPTYNGFKGTPSPYGSKVGKEFNAAIAPRIGIAWDPTGSGTTSVRAGYGMFYDGGLEIGNAELNVGLSQGFLTNLSTTRSTLAAPAGVTTTVTSGTPFTIQNRMPVDYKSPYTQQWSLDVQHQFSNSWFMDVGYYGNNGIHLPGIFDPNEPTPFAYRNCTAANPCYAGPVKVAGSGVSWDANGVNSTATTNKLNVLRPYIGYGPAVGFADVYTSNYNSLQTQVTKKFSGNSSLAFVYTWSHGLTTAPTDRSSGAANIPQANGYAYQNYGPNVADRRHVFTTNFVYYLPWMKAQKGVVGHLLGGWQTSGILTFQTGLPLTASISNAGCNAGSGAACVDAIGGGCLGASPVGCRVNQIGQPNFGAPEAYYNWINAGAFTVPTATQTFLPTEAPGAIRAPGFWNLDFSVFKNMKFTERFNGQFRVETFNTFNHTNPICCASLSYGSSAFNTVTSTRDPRIVQLAMKLNF